MDWRPSRVLSGDLLEHLDDDEQDHSADKGEDDGAEQDITMTLKHLFLAAPAALLVLGGGAANAGKTIEEAGALACVTTSGTRRKLRRAIS